jgi:hypothetical protein
MKNISKAFPIFATAILVGCGGGGGSDTNNTSIPAGIQITAANAPDAVAYAYSGVEGLGSQSSTGASLATGVSVKAATTGLIAGSLRQLYAGLNAQPVDNFAAGVTITESYDCAGGGTISTSVIAAASDRISNGDTLSIIAANCVEDGDVMNGRIDYGFSNLSGTIGSSSAWGAKLTLNFRDFSIKSGGDSISANGDMTLNFNQTSYGVASASVSGSSLQLGETKSDRTVIDYTLTGYSFNFSVNASTVTFGGNFAIRGSSPRLGNVSFTVRSNAQFRAIGAGNPSVGSLTVIAADNSSATVTVLDSTNVKIDLDKNGDGVIEETITTTWADLRSRI